MRFIKYSIPYLCVLLSIVSPFMRVCKIIFLKNHKFCTFIKCKSRNLSVQIVGFEIIWENNGGTVIKLREL